MWGRGKTGFHASFPYLEFDGRSWLSCTTGSQRLALAREIEVRRVDCEVFEEVGVCIGELNCGGGPRHNYLDWRIPKSLPDWIVRVGGSDGVGLRCQRIYQRAVGVETVLCRVRQVGRDHLSALPCNRVREYVWIEVEDNYGVPRDCFEAAVYDVAVSRGRQNAFREAEGAVIDAEMLFHSREER